MIFVCYHLTQLQTSTVRTGILHDVCGELESVYRSEDRVLMSRTLICIPLIEMLNRLFHTYQQRVSHDYHRVIRGLLESY